MGRNHKKGGNRSRSRKGIKKHAFNGGSAKRSLVESTTSKCGRCDDRLFVFKNTLWCASSGCVPCAYKIVVQPGVGCVKNQRPADCRRFPLDPSNKKNAKEGGQLVGLPEWGIGDKHGNILEPATADAWNKDDNLGRLSQFQDPWIMGKEAEAEVEKAQQEQRRRQQQKDPKRGRKAMIHEFDQQSKKQRKRRHQEEANRDAQGKKSEEISIKEKKRVVKKPKHDDDSRKGPHNHVIMSRDEKARNAQVDRLIACDTDSESESSDEEDDEAEETHFYRGLPHYLRLGATVIGSSDAPDKSVENIMSASLLKTLQQRKEIKQEKKKQRQQEAEQQEQPQRQSQEDMNLRRSIGLYNRRQHILTVGDGDFSFSLALARRLRPTYALEDREHQAKAAEAAAAAAAAGGSDSGVITDDDVVDPGSLIATSYEPLESLRRSYPRIEQTLAELKSLGVSVYHKVNAEDLQTTLLPHLKKAQTKSIAHFDRIVWNFPCVGDLNGADAQADDLVRNRAMLGKFLVSAGKLVRAPGAGVDASSASETSSTLPGGDGGGEVHILHKTKPPFSFWDIASLARAEKADKRESKSGVAYVGSVVYDVCMYPGYASRKALNNTSFPVFDSQTYVFAAGSRGSAGQSTPATAIGADALQWSQQQWASAPELLPVNGQLMLAVQSSLLKPYDQLTVAEKEQRIGEQLDPEQSSVITVAPTSTDKKRLVLAAASSDKAKEIETITEKKATIGGAFGALMGDSSSSEEDE